MSSPVDKHCGIGHEHVFLGAGHDENARKTWAVIALCGVMMIVEIIGGSIFGSLALVADGLHMSTHAGAMLIAALAYTFARKHARDRRFVFGTGKIGDLAGFTSAIILAMIALLIGYEAVSRFLAPVPIRFSEAIPIAVLGLIVNIVSAWLLSGGDHGHSHGHSHGHGRAHGHGDPGDDHEHRDESQRIETASGAMTLSIFEEDVPPVFRIQTESSNVQLSRNVTVTTERTDGSRQAFAFKQGSGDFLESTLQIPEPHAFKAVIALAEETHAVDFVEHEHHDERSVDARDHNIRAAYIHVIADAAVSVLAIIGLLLAETFGWLWMDPLAGIVGACVIANWSYRLVRATGAILVDISPDETVENRIKSAVASAGDTLVDLHVWRLGPGHLGAVLSVVSSAPDHGPAFYHAVMQRLRGLSHITVEVHQLPLPA